MQWTGLFNLWCFALLICNLGGLEAVEPNFEDIHDAKEEPQGETINIDQARLSDSQLMLYLSD